MYIGDGCASRKRGRAPRALLVCMFLLELLLFFLRCLVFFLYTYCALAKIRYAIYAADTFIFSEISFWMKSGTWSYFSRTIEYCARPLVMPRSLLT